VPEERELLRIGGQVVMSKESIDRCTAVERGDIISKEQGGNGRMI